jgi:hypothetical protein
LFVVVVVVGYTQDSCIAAYLALRGENGKGGRQAWKWDGWMMASGEQERERFHDIAL